MKPQLRPVGICRSPVVVIDSVSGLAQEAAALALEMAPFPSVGHSLYPGVRRVITESDADAFEYVSKICSDAAPFIAGAFERDRFDLIEASFSLVTVAPHDLAPLQRLPHFDSTDPNYLALLHFLRVPPRTGTAFFRQRSTGIEEVTDQNVADFVQNVRREGEALATNQGYVQGSNIYFEELDRVEAVEDRLLIYRGSLLHSGIIPNDMPLSVDPRIGRLTTNIFVQLR